jgi:hypothetical protein
MANRAEFISLAENQHPRQDPETPEKDLETGLL